LSKHSFVSILLESWSDWKEAAEQSEGNQEEDL
jgi:hypothetical protein